MNLITEVTFTKVEITTKELALLRLIQSTECYIEEASFAYYTGSVALFISNEGIHAGNPHNLKRLDDKIFECIRIPSGMYKDTINSSSITIKTEEKFNRLIGKRIWLTCHTLPWNWFRFINEEEDLIILKNGEVHTFTDTFSEDKGKVVSWGDKIKEHLSSLQKG